MIALTMISVFFTTFLLFYAFIPVFRGKKKSSLHRRIKDATGYEEAKQIMQKDGSFMDRAVIPMTNELRRHLKRQISPGKADQMELKLLQAGSPFDLTPVDFRLIQLILMVVFPLLTLGLTIIGRFPFGQQMLMVLLAFVFAVWFPSFYLQQKAKKRRWKALRELPDFLDLLTVSIEAGLGFDAAISKVVQKQQGILVGEFHRYLDEIRLGITRKDALIGVKDRLNFDELTQCIGGIIQADRMGVGMVKVLRIQSEEMRDKRKMRAEEEAMKAPVKMLFPLVLFIFPSLFIVLLGPAVISIMTEFGK